MPTLTKALPPGLAFDRNCFSRHLLRVLGLVALSLCWSQSAFADPTTFNYSGTLTEIFALGSATIDDEFVLDEAVDLSVTWDPDVAEEAGTLSDPDRGAYRALDSYSIEFPDNLDLTSPFGVVAGGLNFMDVINDLFGTVDQVIVVGQISTGDTLTGTLDGATPAISSLTFSDFDMMGGIPLMLVDDSLPDMPLDAASALVTLSLTPGVSVTLTITELTVPEPAFGAGLLTGFFFLASAAGRRDE